MKKKNRVDNGKKRELAAPAKVPANGSADGPQEARCLVALVCSELDDDQITALATALRQISNQYITQQ
jgi:hypothetical protein